MIASRSDATLGAADAADVVVVGAGVAGLLAAIEASEAGARVVVLQKLPEPGGKSSLAIGSISAAGTTLQQRRGIVDGVEAHERDLRARIAAGGVEPLAMDKLELAVRHGADALERLIELGVRFSGPHPEKACEAWRMHVIVPDTRSLVATLADQARRRGARIRGDWPVDQLLTDSSGRVTGVDGPRGAVRARSGVVLATGDFSAPSRLGPSSPVGSRYAFRPWASGDGHHLAEQVGGVLTHLDKPLRLQLRTVDWPHLEPYSELVREGAVLVDRSGRRIVDETADAATEIAHGGDPEVFLVLAGRLVRRIATAEEDSPEARDGWLRSGKLYIGTFPGIAYAYVEDVVRAGYAVLMRSLRELAAALGIDAGGLEAELTGYSAGIAAGVPDRLGRRDRRATIDDPPFLGIGPLRARAILGRAGVATDELMRVRRAGSSPVGGLLAAGAAAGVTGFAYGHGYELAWAVVSGRIAGRVAAGGA